MQWPTLAAWSDPIVTDVDLLTALAAIHGNAAVGVAVNPNVPAEVLDDLVEQMNLTQDNAGVLARHVMARMSDAGQLALLRRAGRRGDANMEAIARGCRPGVVADVLRGPALVDPRAPQRATRVLSSTVISQVEFAHRHRKEISDELADLLTLVAPTVNGYCEAVVYAWQPRDARRMTELLQRGRPFHDIPGVTVGVPGLAEQWFALGGWYRKQACADLDLPVEVVTSWLTELGDYGQKKEAVLNPRVPLEVVRLMSHNLLDASFTHHQNQNQNQPDGNNLDGDGADDDADDEDGEDDDWGVSWGLRSVMESIHFRIDRFADAITGTIDQLTNAQVDQLCRLASGQMAPALVHALYDRCTDDQRKALLSGVSNGLSRWAPIVRNYLAEREPGLANLGVLAQRSNPGQPVDLDELRRTERDRLTRHNRPSPMGLLIAYRQVPDSVVVVSPVARELVERDLTAAEWKDLFESAHVADAERNGPTLDMLLRQLPQQGTTRARSLDQLIGNALGDD